MNCLLYEVWLSVSYSSDLLSFIVIQTMKAELAVVTLSSYFR